MMRTMSPPKALEDLREISTEIQHLDSILSLLHWDQETYMPLGGISPRSHQISTLSALIHEKKTSKKKQPISAFSTFFNKNHRAQSEKSRDFRLPRPSL